MKICVETPPRSYVTPEIEMVEIVSEGILCDSATDPWEEDGSLNF